MNAKTYQFACLKSCRSYRVENKEIWTLTVRLKDLPTTFEYGPNARFATLDKKPAKDMLTTLKSNPEAFIFNNNGIMLVAESLRAESDSVEIVCKNAETEEDGPGHGVLNGGHTYRALTWALGHSDEYPNAAEKAVVVLTVALGIPPEDIARISKARNTSEKVPLHALRELAGDWLELKRYLPERSRSMVAFKPDDPETPDALFDVTDVVRRLALFNNRLFPVEQGVHPVKAYTSIGSLVRDYKRTEFMDFAPLLPDILRLEELIVKHYEQSRGHKNRDPSKIGRVAGWSGNSAQSTTLLSGYQTDGLTIADPFVLPILAAFRVFIRDGKWLADMDDLWERYGGRIVAQFVETYLSDGNSSAAVWGRAKTTWAMACDLTKSVAIQNGYIQIT